MKGFPLPPKTGEPRKILLPTSRQVSLIGANGAGKSRFMDQLIENAGQRAYCLSPLTDAFPGNPVPGFSELTERLVADHAAPVFSRVKDLWEKLFPGNSIVVSDSRIRFITSAGSDLIPPERLSRGERTALYYLAAVVYAPRRAVVFVDSPSLFLHPSLVNQFWNRLEQIRPDCRFIYDSPDAVFIGSRTENVIIWIRSYDSAVGSWDYDMIDSSLMSEELYVDMIGSRRPVLFIEGDSVHSIDSRLYTLVFPEYAVRPLGSCDKVIEATRSFTTLRQYHPLDIHGLVDRDRRTAAEVDYLRKRNIMVPEVAEVENIFLARGVVRTMAEILGKDSDRIIAKVEQTVMKIFAENYEAQALQHTRHKMKRDVERKIDARFSCITALELHIKGLINKLRPREHFESLMCDFERMLVEKDYQGILRVFNHKPMLTDSNVARLLGFPNAESYITGVIGALRHTDDAAARLRDEIRSLFVAPVEKEELSIEDFFADSKRVFRHMTKDPLESAHDHSGAHSMRRRRHATPGAGVGMKPKRRAKRSNSKRKRNARHSPDADLLA